MLRAQFMLYLNKQNHDELINIIYYMKCDVKIDENINQITEKIVTIHYGDTFC